MKKIIFLILLTGFTGIGNSAEIPDTLVSSVLTVSPGNELYSTFGHTAIRIRDLKNGNDYVFNYGTFDFNTQDFYIKFALGKLDYILSIELYDGFIEACKLEERTVKEQILNFNKTQNYNLFQLLIEGYKPENRYYRYKFFTDNCCTRVRDILVMASGDSTLLEISKVETNSTFRDLFTRYLKTMLWSRFGIELVLGTLTDKKAGYDALFIPDNLKKSIDLAMLGNKHLVSEERIIVEYDDQKNQNTILTPLFITLLILVTTLLIQFKKQWVRIYDNIFFLLTGLLGSFICYLTIFSEHAELHNNMVVLFLLPANIILPFLKPSSFRKYYCLAALSIVLIGIIFMPLLPQKFNFAFIVLTVGLGIRFYFNQELIVLRRR
jgi:hypothetical protein